MHVMHVLKHSNHGHGNVHVAVDLACLQSRQGLEVSFASTGGDYDELLRREGVRLDRVEQSSNNAQALLWSTAQLIKVCRRNRPDIIHAHMMSAAVVGFAVSRALGIPLVSTVHNSFDRHSVLMRLADTVVAVSQAERKTLLERGFSAKRTVVVSNGPNGTPREEFLPEGPPIVLRRPSISTLCGLHRRKGVFDLIEAMALLPPHLADWHLYIIGDGPDRAELETMSISKGVSSKVVFLGQLSRPKLVLRQTDIFALASYAEPFGLATAEARDSGCALVATNVGGSPELLDYGRSGILVTPGRPDEFAAAFAQMAQSPQTLAAWRERSKTGSHHFCADRVARDYVAVYDELLRRRICRVPRINAGA